MKKYEYKIIDSKDVKSKRSFRLKSREDVVEYLNEFGLQGWELVNVDFREMEGGLSFAGVMKREI